MVHDKKRSGDPDYDDKVPLTQQLGETVKGPDGRDVLLTESVGPINPDGSHANLDEDPDARDNRPAPGGVAEEPSEVQHYERPTAKAKPKSDPKTTKADRT